MYIGGDEMDLQELYTIVIASFVVLCMVVVFSGKTERF
jgi:hypothetical protein